MVKVKQIIPNGIIHNLSAALIVLIIIIFIRGYIYYQDYKNKDLMDPDIWNTWHNEHKLNFYETLVTAIVVILIIFIFRMMNN